MEVLSHLEASHALLMIVRVAEKSEILAFTTITERKPEHTRYTLKAQCGKGNKNLVERGLKLNEQGHKIGERCLTIYPKAGAHIFWTEGNDYWFITTTSLEIAKEFESSEAFRLWKSGKYDDLK